MICSQPPPSLTLNCLLKHDFCFPARSQCLAWSTSYAHCILLFLPLSPPSTSKRQRQSKRDHISIALISCLFILQSLHNNASHPSNPQSSLPCPPLPPHTHTHTPIYLPFTSSIQESPTQPPFATHSDRPPSPSYPYRLLFFSHMPTLRLDN